MKTTITTTKEKGSIGYTARSPKAPSGCIGVGNTRAAAKRDLINQCRMLGVTLAQANL